MRVPSFEITVFILFSFSSHADLPIPLAYIDERAQSWKKTQWLRLNGLRDLRGSLPHVASERIGEVGLVEIAELVGGVKNGAALFQQRGGLPGSLDLLHSF